jgi:NAD/NADP transhydrogenase alpha subunit
MILLVIKFLDNRNNIRAITGGTNINISTTNNTIFVNGNNTISGITNLASTLSSLAIRKCYCSNIISIIENFITNNIITNIS